jgi:hypothetical protein
MKFNFKNWVCILYTWHIFAICGTLLLGVEVITGYKPLIIDQSGPGILETIEPTPEQKEEGKKRYFFMRIGLVLVIVDIIVHIPPIKRKISGLIS